MTDISRLITAMSEYEAGCPRRIHHFLKVYAFAKAIGEQEGLPPETQRILEGAAVVHDAGIRPALEKYGSPAGPYQEKEGPAVVREMLTKLGDWTPEETERICTLVGRHHTYEGIDGLDCQILIEADFLVNLYEEGETAQAAEQVKRKIFRTAAGTRFLEELFLADPDFLKN